MKAKELSIVIPAYNEGSHIAASLAIIIQYAKLATGDYELIVVVDGSTDNTWSEAVEFSRNNRNVTVLKLSRNFGKELALCAGLDHASGKAVIVMDADLQHPPELIPEMFRIWRKGQADVVECVKRKRAKESFIKKMCARLYYKTLNYLTKCNFEGASDYKLLDRKVVDAWGEMNEKNTFFRGMTTWLGFERKTIEFDVPQRIEGDSRWSLYSLCKLAVHSIIAFSSVPLRLVSFFGISFLLIGAVLGAQTMYRKLANNADTGFTTVIILQLLIGSIIMISLGVVGEYLASMYHEVKGRPRYVISKTTRYEQNEIQNEIQVVTNEDIA